MTRRRPPPRLVHSLSGHGGLRDGAPPEAFGDAMLRCQGYAPGCSDAGECAYGGFCHQPRGIAYAAVARELRGLLAAAPSGSERWRWLNLAMQAVEREANWQRNAIWRAVVKRHRLQARLKAQATAPRE